LPYNKTKLDYKTMKYGLVLRYLAYLA